MKQAPMISGSMMYCQPRAVYREADMNKDNRNEIDNDTKLERPPIRLLSLTDPERAAESAAELEHAGVDELYFLYEQESDIERIKEITRTVDIPVCVQISPERFEDVKKVLYAGASSVCLVTDKEEVRKEVLGRFGAEKIGGRQSGCGYGRLILEIPDPSGEQRILDQRVCADSPVPVILQLSDGMEAERTSGHYLKETGADGVILSYREGLRAGAVKQTWREQGLTVHTFASAIPFSDFKKNGDGLIPVIVQDYRTCEVLMLAYMNEEAYDRTIETGRMTYYSRSRQKLWIKGETSGHYQYVKALHLDCDNDTILAKVEQIGAACHTGSYSCFFQELVKKDYKDENPLMILKQDYDVIAERKRNPKEGSYTNYLFDKGIDKILKKVGEEATEMVIAAKNPDAEELKYEISDFLYHMMVLMVDQGLTWEDITRELVERR